MDISHIEPGNGRKIVVGMSGGVDSSMCLVLLKKAGWEPIGVSLKLPVWENKLNMFRQNVCCSDDSLAVAKKICDSMGVPFHIVDIREHFKNEIIDYFVTELENGRTPNPCVKCNRKNKYEKLFEWGEANGVKYACTGHYARIKYNKETKQYELIKPVDGTKDQTYGLSFLPQEYLKRMVLPLGDFSKKEVYDMAEEAGFEFFRKTRESQDLCFVSGKAFKHFIHERIGEKPGDIVNEKGEKLGEHKGLHFFTIGQVKGLNLPKKHYVKELDVETNRVVVAETIEKVTQKEIIVSPFNFTTEAPTSEIRITAKIRYGPTLSAGTLFPPDSEGKVKIIFDEPQTAVTPGQFAVVYQDNICIGSGVINRKGANKGLLKLEPVKDVAI